MTSWPRLYGRLATARPASARGRWREVDGRRERAGTFAFRAPNLWQRVDDDGVLQEGGRPWWQVELDQRDDDYCLAAGPVRRAEHDGRPAWQVDLAPPRHKQGLLTLAVDDTTGLLVGQSNATAGVLQELTALEVDVALDDGVFAPLLARQARWDREQALQELVRRRPPPTPRWLPGRRIWLEDVGCVGVPETGLVARADTGTGPQLGWFAPEHLHRFDALGWSWVVGTAAPISLAEAHEVVAQVRELE